MSVTDDHTWRCRICRLERLLGRRTQAALTAGVLAVASIAPTAAFAQQSPVAVDEAPADFDVGGAAEELAEEAGGEPEVEVESPAPDAPPVAVAPKPGSAAPAPGVEAADGPDVTQPTADAPEAPAPAPEATAPPTAPPTAPAPAATAEPAPPGADDSTPADGAEPEDIVEPRPARRGKTERTRNARTTPPSVQAAPRAAQPPVGRSEAPPVRAVVPAPAPSAAAPASVAPAPAPAAAPARRAAGVTRGWHVVQRGESLWSIAAEQLKRSASTAEIAREVERLWELNRQRIGTGDRDVLMAGTRLKL